VQIAGYREALERLGEGGIAPSLRAADVVLAVMEARRNRLDRGGTP